MSKYVIAYYVEVEVEAPPDRPDLAYRKADRHLPELVWPYRSRGEPTRIVHAQQVREARECNAAGVAFAYYPRR